MVLGWLRMVLFCSLVQSVENRTFQFLAGLTESKVSETEMGNRRGANNKVRQKWKVYRKVSESGYVGVGLSLA